MIPPSLNKKSTRKKGTCKKCSLFRVIFCRGLCGVCYASERYENNKTHFRAINRRYRDNNKARIIASGYNLSEREYLDIVKECFICGYDLIVDVHHIIPKSEGGEDYIQNYVGLCPNCHALVHKRKYSLEELEEMYKTGKILNLKDNI